MKFTIARTWDRWHYSDREKYKTQYDSYFEMDTIEIISLPEIIDLIKSFEDGRAVIDADGEIPHIEIYDDYRE